MYFVFIGTKHQPADDYTDLIMTEQAVCFVFWHFSRMYIWLFTT